MLPQVTSRTDAIWFDWPPLRHFDDASVVTLTVAAAHDDLRHDVDLRLPDRIREVLTQAQHDLFDLGGELCIPGMAMISDADITRLEDILDAFNETLPPLKDFILPGGGVAAANCHLARTICRRAEREVVTLSRHETVRGEAIRYLNRLSDLLFVLARVLARESGHGEVLWQHERRKRDTK